MPAVQLLLLDTDPQALAEAARRDDSGLTPDETLNLPLRRPQHYREHSQQLLHWLSRRWLYNIPRRCAPKACGRWAGWHLRGSRPANRPANSPAISQALEAESISATAQTTQLGRISQRRGAGVSRGLDIRRHRQRHVARRRLRGSRDAGKLNLGQSRRHWNHDAFDRRRSSPLRTGPRQRVFLVDRIPAFPAARLAYPGDAFMRSATARTGCRGVRSCVPRSLG